MEKINNEEALKNSDQVLATVFRVTLLQERTAEMVSGMMYRPSEEKIAAHFDQLFNFDGQSDLEETDTEQLKGLVLNTFKDITNFVDNKAKVGYQTSYPQSPVPGQTSNTLMKFSPPDRGSECPTVLFFIDGDKINYQMQSGKFEAPKDGTVKELKPFASGLLEKVRKLLLSKAFQDNFGKLQENLSYSPKDDLRKWASY